MKSKIIKILHHMLHPYSPIATLAIGSIVTFLATGSDLPPYIEKILENKDLLTGIIIVWLIIAIFHTFLNQTIESQREEIQELKNRIKEKENQISQNSGVILNKYGELAKFNKKNRFYDIIKSFVENNIGIDCTQIYKYSSKSSDGSMKIRLNFEEGYSYEDVDINVLLQSYFTVDIQTFKDISGIIKLWDNFNERKDLSRLEREALEKKLFEEIEKLSTKLIGNLNSIVDTDNIEEYHYTYYRIVLLIINIVNEIDNINEISRIMENEEVENHLIVCKRTGILGAILLNDNFIFKHEGISSKNGRVYIAFTINLYNENYVVLVAISKSQLDELDDWKEYFEVLKEDFMKRIESTD